MKKLFALLSVLAVLVTVTAGCASTKPNETTGTTTAQEQGPESALQILETVWASYGEEEKFSVIGGSMDAPVDNAPGSFNIADTESLTYSLLVPAEQIAKIDQAASMIHMMNANTFTCGVFRMASGADASAFAAAMKDAVLQNQWMCGFPDRLIVAVIGGDYVLTAFGVNDAMGPFETKLVGAYPSAQLLYKESIT